MDRAALARMLQQRQPGNMPPEAAAGGIPPNSLGAPGALNDQAQMLGVPPELLGQMDPLVLQQLLMQNRNRPMPPQMNAPGMPR